MSLFDILSKVTNFVVKREDNIKRALFYLNKYGYVSDAQENTVEGVIAAIKRLQVLGGLLPTGELDGKTLNLMAQPRCGMADYEQLTENAAQPNKWGLSTLTWYVSGYDREVSKAEWVASIDEALYNWSAVCKLKFEQVQSLNEANLVFGIGRGQQSDFDGPSGVLAWFQLCPAFNFKGRLSGVFDEDETWIPKGRTARGIYLVNVACHEVGHGLIGTHSKVNSALMAPFYSPSVAKPQQNDDILRAVKLYGQPINVPTPTPPSVPTPTDEADEIVIRLKGKGASVSIDGHRISKIG